jgi:lipid II:glycine glycyltransferase (peptidoglycan interpeptide bridge formation enzyme)
VTVNQRNHFDDLKIFYEMLRESSRRKKFPLRSFAYFKSLWRNLAPNGNAKLFFADYHGKPLAGELVLKFGNMCWDMYRASMNHHKNLRPNYALQWKIMQWAKNNSCIWYSLRGVPSFNPPPDHTGYGVYKFKKGFGGMPLTFAGDYYYIFKPKLYGYWEKGEVLINKVGRLLLKLLSG